jgi:hypothetical protein
MKKYLFIGGPASGQSHETNGTLHVSWYNSPVFDGDEPLGDAWSYSLRSLSVGDTHTNVYVLSQLCDSNAIDLLLEAYQRYHRTL